MGQIQRRRPLVEVVGTKSGEGQDAKSSNKTTAVGEGPGDACGQIVKILREGGFEQNVMRHKTYEKCISAVTNYV